MANSFTTSINILRDTDKDFDYIPTPNAIQVVSQIVNDFKKGIRSFNIIGTYGTGKSSFLLALEQSIEGRKHFFEANFIPAKSKAAFVKIVGSYSSIVEQFAEIFEVNTSKNKHEHILSEIFNRYHTLGENNGILFLFLDEFGKFLEYASKHNPENELYFIQQLAEFCNNPKHNIVLITTVHQNFDSYAYSLTSTQRQEWVKVKGRFREITFNEPVEQLLFLASEYVSQKFKNKAPKGEIEKCLKLIEASKSINFSRHYADEIKCKIFPLDLLSAYVLTLSLQKYGQNERSLFSFLESTDHTGLSKFNHYENPFYNLSCIYDYLNFNFYSFITSKYNPDFSSWSTIRTSLEKTERIFDTQIADYAKAIKTVGLLNIFSAGGSILDTDFLVGYLKTACGLSNPETIIKNLETNKIIRYRLHSKRYILFEGTDLDIQTALNEAANKLSEVNDITIQLNKYFQFTPVFAKLYSYETGTPRFFQFKISENPIDLRPEGEIDGFINLIFNSKLKIGEVEQVSKTQEEAIIYCYFKNSEEIKNLLFEIEKIEKVIEENNEDKVAKRELENIADAQKRLLNHYILDNIYSGSKDVKWFFKGEEKIIANKKDFNKLISQVCSIVYNATPIFKNELVNKHKISPSIYSAKRNYFKALANSWDKENLGFDDSKFPPEKTIFLSLIKENGFSLNHESLQNFISNHKNSSFYNLWKASEEFLQSAKTEQKPISLFVEILDKRPFKLKRGLIDLWVPTFLFIKRMDFALFSEIGYIPLLSDENLELLAKYPKEYSIKTFDIEGVKLDIFNSYRTFLNQSTENKFDNVSFIETIKPFIVFYKQLPEYSKQTQRLTSAALKIRNAIVQSKDPEVTFFESFPNALGASLSILKQDKEEFLKFSNNLQSAVRELRTCFDGLVQRFEDYLCDEFIGQKVDFDSCKKFFQIRYTKLRRHLLLANQKTFILRIDSKLDDKKAWLNSLAQSVTGKTLENFSDEDEFILYEKFKTMILDLDSLTNISNADIDETREEVISVKIDSFFSSINPTLVRYPKAKAQEIEFLKENLRKKLGKDNTSNVAALLTLLKELLK